ncbi:primosomal protein N' [subsurface metagenome]
MSRYIEVAVGLPIDRLFHYAIPTHLEEEVALGKRVLIPFGSRQITGYIAGSIEESPMDRIREIIDVIDREPILSPRMLRLTKWISDYYLSPWGQIIEAALPIGMKMESKKVIKLKEIDLVKVIPEIEKKSSDQAQVLKILEGKKEMSLEGIMRRMKKKGVYSAVNALEKKGLVESRLILKERLVKPKTIQIVEAKEISEEVLKRLEKGAPKQAQALKILRESKEEMTPPQLAKKARTSTSTIKSLKEKGLLNYVLKEVRRRVKEIKELEKEIGKLKLTEEQRKALGVIERSIDQKKGEVILLQGPRESGKERIYLEAITRSLSKGKGAILLYPEIIFASRAFACFTSYLGDRVAILHSELSPGVRYDEWRRIKKGMADVVIGTRLAIFAPLKNLGLIIIDGEEETSYKQEEVPRYHTREVALRRAKESGATVILASGSPTLESYYEVKNEDYRLVRLSQRIDKRKLPEIKLVDMRIELTQKKNRSIFSLELQERMRRRLGGKGQVILFLNRRGFASFILCRECGHVLRCPNCNLTLTYHFPDRILRCHHCNYSIKVPETCPRCRGYYMRPFGIGTQRVEEAARKLFSKARVMRMDTDTTKKKGSYERIVRAFEERRVDILVGTQMVLKGVEYKGEVLLGVVSADTALNLPDFRATERTFALLSQVGGRAGRGSLPDEVIIQTYTPEHYGIREACFGNYESFYNREIEYRKELSYPPFSHLINILIRSNIESQAQRVASSLASALIRAKKKEPLQILGPSPAPLTRVKGQYRWQVALKGKDIENLRRVLRPILKREKTLTRYSNVFISVDVDPVALL